MNKEKERYLFSSGALISALERHKPCYPQSPSVYVIDVGTSVSRDPLGCNCAPVPNFGQGTLQNEIISATQ